MPKPIVFIAALLLALPAFAQTRMPARQVEADTNMVNITVSYPFTAQAALDWIDANWMAVDPSGWASFPTNLFTVQAALDWADDNWMLIDTNSWTNLFPAASTVQAVFDYIDEEGVGDDELDPSGWSAIGTVFPGCGEAIGTNLFTNAVASSQEAMDSVDEWLAGLQGCRPMPGTNIVGSTLVSDQWTGLMPGTNIVGASYANENGTNQWTIDFPTDWRNVVESNTVFAVKTSTQSSAVKLTGTTITSYDNSHGATNLFNKASGVFTCQYAGNYIIFAGFGAKSGVLETWDGGIYWVSGAVTNSVSIGTTTIGASATPPQWAAMSGSIYAALNTGDVVYVQAATTAADWSSTNCIVEAHLGAFLVSP